LYHHAPQKLTVGPGFFANERRKGKCIWHKFVYFRAKSSGLPFLVI
jgi:hypothetical protein